MSENIIVRKMIEQDLPDVLRIADESLLSHWSESDYRLQIGRPDSINAVASLDAQNTGFFISRLIIMNSSCELFNIAVEIKSRKKGIGSFLVEYLVKLCLEQEIRTVLLDVRQSNTQALSFYKKLGFEAIGKQKNFYTTPSDDALVLRLSLQSPAISGTDL